MNSANKPLIPEEKRSQEMPSAPESLPETPQPEPIQPQEQVAPEGGTKIEVTPSEKFEIEEPPALVKPKAEPVGDQERNDLYLDNITKMEAHTVGQANEMQKVFNQDK